MGQRGLSGTGFPMSMPRRIVAILLLGLMAGSLAHARGPDLTCFGGDETSIEQGAGQWSDGVHAVAGNCALVCPGAACIGSLPDALNLLVASTQPSAALAAVARKHLRAPDTAPPRASFA